jgi:hypothetical protein
MKIKFILIVCIQFCLQNVILAQNNLLVNAPITTTPGANNNTVFGLNSGLSQTSASENSLFGSFAGSNLKAGSKNTLLGYQSGFTLKDGLNNTFVGEGSGIWSNGTNNVYIGSLSGKGNAASTSLNTGTANTFVGTNSGAGNTSGSENVFFGLLTGQNNTIGFKNTFIGQRSGQANTTGNLNIAVGSQAGNFNATGSGNVFIGNSSGVNNISGSANLYLGNNAGSSGTNSNGNIFIGNGVQSISSVSNELFIGNSISDTPLIRGNMNNRDLTFNLNNNVNSRLVVNSFNTGNALGTSGLRFANLTSNNTNLVAPTGSVLTVNANGDVVLTSDQVSAGSTGITNSCTNNVNFVPKTADNSGNLTCSQIFDNGTNVGIGTGAQSTSFFDYTIMSGDFSAEATTPGNAKLRVAGVTWSNGFYAASDKKFKKDIKQIASSLETIQKINGKTYSWNKNENKDRNFDQGLHSGFIAQELEKVLPHLVATSGDGSKAVNYIELMPYLVEAIKEQQTQISELKSQIAQNNKLHTLDFIKFFNTKIINVSPNPSDSFIEVSFNIDSEIKSAYLEVFDLQGSLQSSLKISERGLEVKRVLQKDNFATGIYILSLSVNGKSIDTKRIVFN